MLTLQSMSSTEFQVLSELIETISGIKMSEEKKIMVESRLHKRVSTLGLPGFSEYLTRLFDQTTMEDERQVMLDLVSTHKTDFFREPFHFEYLSHQVLPRLSQLFPCTATDPLVVWSAACSTGEEPYTLAMVLEEYRASRHRMGFGFEYLILATDLAANVLNTGRRAIYEASLIEPIPPHLRSKYLLRSKDADGRVRICTELRERVLFHRLNFMEQVFELSSPVHVIFCRNALIYFKAEIQQAIVRKLLRFLRKDGFFFVGHSESLQHMALSLKNVATTVYRRDGDG